MATKAETPDYENLPGPPEPTGGEALWPELPRARFEALLGKGIVILEVELRDSDPKYGKEGTQFAILRLKAIDDEVSAVAGDDAEVDVTVAAGDEFTSSTGGVRVVEQLRKTAEFPMACVPGREATQGGRSIYTLLPIGAAS